MMNFLQMLRKKIALHAMMARLFALVAIAQMRDTVEKWGGKK